MENVEFIGQYFDEMKEIIKKIDRQRIGSVIDALMRAREGGNTIYIMGNGGSASTATHFTCDLSKVTIVGDKKRFKVRDIHRAAQEPFQGGRRRHRLQRARRLWQRKGRNMVAKPPEGPPICERPGRHGHRIQRLRRRSDERARRHLRRCSIRFNAPCGVVPSRA